MSMDNTFSKDKQINAMVIKAMIAAYDEPVSIGLENGIVRARSKQLCLKYLGNVINFNKLFLGKVILIDDIVTSIDMINGDSFIYCGNKDIIYSASRLSCVDNIIGCKLRREDLNNGDYLDTIAKIKIGDRVKIMGILKVLKGDDNSAIFQMEQSRLIYVNDQLTNIAIEVRDSYGKANPDALKEGDSKLLLKNPVNEVFGLNGYKISLGDQHKLFDRLYQIYRKKINEWMLLFDKSYEADYKAIDSLKLSGFSSAIKRCEKEKTDTSVYTEKLLSLIADYRKDQGYISPKAVFSLIANELGGLGNHAFQALCETASSQEELKHLRKLFNQCKRQAVIIKYHKLTWESCDELLEDYYERELQSGQLGGLNQIIQDRYDFRGPISENIERVSGLFSDCELTSKANLLEEAKKEITWRESYGTLKPIVSDTIRTELEKISLYLLEAMNKAFHLGMPEDFFSYDLLKETKAVYKQALQAGSYEDTDLLIKAFAQFPYEPKGYKCLLKVFKDETGELSKIASFMGQEKLLSKYKIQEKVAKNRLRGTEILTSMQRADYKGLLDLRDEILALDDPKGCIEEIMTNFFAYFNAKDIEERSFNKHVYDTAEEKYKAVDDFNTLCAKYPFNLIEALTEAECNEAIAFLREGDFTSNISEIFMKKVEERIQKIWKEEDIEILSKIFLDTDVNNGYALAKGIEQIKKVGRTPDKERFAALLSLFSKENLELIKAGFEIEKKRKDAKGLIDKIKGIADESTLSKSKQLWKQMTWDNQLIHPALEALKNEKVCPFCGVTIEDGAKFCRACGKSLKPEKIHCSVCGCEVKEGSKFCYSCGNKI